MLRLRSEFLPSASTDPVAGLRRSLQQALALEHATIPAYLSALYSIKPGWNREVAAILRSVVVEEMLHLTIVANLLNAVGGEPVLDDPAFIPVFPAPLPMGVGGDLEVGLEPLTTRLVRRVFMTIEEPEDPEHYRLAPVDRSAGVTIGQFYADICETVTSLGAGVFTGRRDRQVVAGRWFRRRDLFPVDGVAAAVRAIRVIVTQGEGTTARTPPRPDAGGDWAHYYRFEQIVRGRALVRNAQTGTYEYRGAPVPLDRTGVWPLQPNATIAGYGESTRARVLAMQFNALYTNLLRSLQETFNGRPENLDAAMGLMHELHLTARALVATPIPGTKRHAAPTFEYTPVHV